LKSDIELTGEFSLTEFIFEAIGIELVNNIFGHDETGYNEL